MFGSMSAHMLKPIKNERRRSKNHYSKQPLTLSGFALESCVENNVQDNVPVNITNIVWYSVWHDVHTNILVNVGNVVRAMSPHMLKQILNEC